MFRHKTVLLVSILGFVVGRTEFLEFAMVYYLINFISVIGVLRLFEAFTAKHNGKVVEPAQRDL